ncbi:MAG TPA: flagellar hook protein [Lachnospiraceae bacterium]|nr:flagellar hook protein [Lachnospiraceae bacterium]
MMRSLYSGVSGLKTHQVKMDVIGNNIANVNTVAYKSQSITFSELMYQTTQAASGPNEATGTAGRNAKQIGLGSTSGAISTAITQQGSTQTTGNAFDLRITGNAFFVVSNGSGNYFTRDGSFYVDAVGNLAMSSTGYNVMGWLPQTDPQTGQVSIVQDSVKKLQILSAENMTSEPQATTKATITGILDKNDSNVVGTNGKAVNMSFYDNLGYSYTAKYTIHGTDEEGIYVMKLNDVIDSNNDSILDKFDATIFTGTDSSGAEANAVKNAQYTIADAYEITDKLKVKYNGTEHTVVIDANGNVDMSNDANKAAATTFAAAYGYDDPEEFFNLTVDMGNNTYEKIGKVLSAATDKYGSYTYTFPTGSDPATETRKVFSGATDRTADGNVLNVDGYKTAAGSAIKISYDQGTGKFTGINGSTATTAFNLSLKPQVETSANPFEDIEIDMSASLNFNNEETSTISAKSGDDKGFGTGCALGKMTGVSIQNNGMIYGAYDNGQTKLLGQIAVASFSNASGLEKEGDNLYKATMNSGEFDGIGIDVTSEGGYLSTGVLEMSNVDLSSEFTEMITTQRGFQANSRIITVSDTLLEELVNLKR